MGQTGFCEYLRFPAVFCEICGFSASEMLYCKIRRKSEKNCQQTSSQLDIWGSNSKRNCSNRALQLVILHQWSSYHHDKLSSLLVINTTSEALKDPCNSTWSAKLSIAGSLLTTTTTTTASGMRTTSTEATEVTTATAVAATILMIMSMAAAYIIINVNREPINLVPYQLGHGSAPISFPALQQRAANYLLHL